MNNKRIGDYGEWLARVYLEEKGYYIAATKYKRQEGEIDIICIKDDKLHFVEVKTRSSCDIAEPIDGITPLKRKRMASTAQSFLNDKKYHIAFNEVVFDAVEVTVNHVVDIMG